MLRCIQLAKNGLGSTYPNPLVGSVIVCDDTIIGEGWHYQSGQPHAEVNAIDSVIDRTLLSKSTIYVSLEPCSHFGKTPPCADLIISSGIRNVVIGSSDPNPEVSGRGIQRLKNAGCNVITGIEVEECDELNKRFFTFHKKKRPYIFLKWAQTTNGYIAPLEREQRAPVWITQKYSRQLVHRMRAQEQAILVGTKTVIEDNPSLTTRDWIGNSPIRIVLDRRLRVSGDAHIFNRWAQTIILNEKVQKKEKNIHFEIIDFTQNITQQIIDLLYRYHIQSVIVEGGSQTLQTFIDANMWDEAYIFTGNTTFAAGVIAPFFEGEFVNELKIKDDTLTQYKNSTN